MTGNEYQEKAMRTLCVFSPNEQVYHGVFLLASEAGEVAGILQKEFQGHDVDVEHVKKELGDCLWAIAEIAEGFGLTLNEIMTANIEKLQKRYPNNFTVDRSLSRNKEDV